MEKLLIGTDGEYANDEITLEQPAARPPQNGWLWIAMAFRMLAER